MKYFSYTIIAIVAIAIISGFFLVGSPQEKRLRRFDERRVQDLQSIQFQIGEFYRAKQRIPADLGELKDEFRGVSAPKDPETSLDYIYQPKAPLGFSLCADFKRPSSDSFREEPKSLAPGFFEDASWDHGEGRKCFDRTIDKDFFTPASKLR